MALAQTPLASSKVVFPIYFGDNGFAANTTTGTIPLVATSNGTLAVYTETMPWDGCIVAMTARLPSAPSAGTLTLQPRINGSLTSFTVEKHVNSSDIQKFYARQEARTSKSRFSAGDNVGLSFTTTSDWAAVQAGAFTVWCLLESVDL